MLPETERLLKDAATKEQELVETNPQGYLDFLLTQDRHHKFNIEGITNWNNHKVLLYLALELTYKSKDAVVEYGCGDGSTYDLRTFCIVNRRTFLTYDSDKDWANKCGSVYVKDWEVSNIFDGNFSVAFIDLAPGEYRKVALEKLRGKAEIIIIHDSEIGGAGDYQVEPGLSQFKYRINYNLTQGGAGVSAVSDTIDLNKFNGCALNGYLLEV